MIWFITVLRALAACLITNSHYTGIYPTDLIANGGLLGDVIFFAVSGYCLYNVKLPFLTWYGKRIYRVYMPVIIITAIYIILGDYSFDDNNFIEYFLYPTYYHFVASIIILYIPFYIFMKSDFLKQHILQVMMAIAVVWIVVYCTIYDSSYYHIDTVREPMIRFLYMECMLLGAWFRQNDVLFRNKFKVLYPIATFVMFLIYFASKIAFSKIERISEFQFLNQVALFVLLVCVMIMFSSLDSRLENIPRVVKEIITFLSNMTLEIYVVQYVLIEKLRSIVFFPLNWIILTTTILISAFILNQLCKFIYSRIDMLSRIIGGGK